MGGGNKQLEERGWYRQILFLATYRKRWEKEKKDRKGKQSETTP